MYRKYVREVLLRIPCRHKVRRRIENDLYSMLEDKARELGQEDPYILMGNPEDVAEEFLENLDEEDISPMAYTGYRPREYRSKTTLWGMPLVHINTRPRGVAKGIIAIGTTAIGILSIGVFSLGIVSFGCISLGLLLGFGVICAGLGGAMGGIAVGGLLAIGGVAISGYMTIGGVAISSKLAVGGVAKAKIGIGGHVYAHVGLYRQMGIGEFVAPITENIEGMKEYVLSKIGNENNFIQWVVKTVIEGLTMNY